MKTALSRVAYRVLSPLAHASFLFGLFTVLCLFGLYEAVERARTRAGAP